MNTFPFVHKMGGLSNPMPIMHRHESYFDVSHPRFAAVGDGVADDTAAIQDAIDAAELYVTNGGKGATVYLPMGHYLVSETLTIQKDGIRIIGEGPGGDTGTAMTMLTPTAAFANNTYVLNFSNPTASTRPLAGCQLRNLRIGKVAALSNTVSGVYWKVYFGVVEDFATKDLTGHAISVQGESGVWDAYQNRFSRLDLWGPGAGDTGSTTHVGFNIIGDVIETFMSDSQIHGFRYGTKGGQTGNRYTGVHFWGNGNNVLIDGGGVQPQFCNCSFREPVLDNFLVDCTGNLSITDLLICNSNWRTTDTLLANNSYDNIRFTRASGSGTVGGVITGNVFLSAGSTNDVRYHVNLSGAVVSQMRLQGNRADNNAATGKYNHSANTVRSLINGQGINVGDPNSTGQWNTFGEQGVVVRNTSDNSIWMAIDASTWIALG